MRLYVVLLYFILFFWFELFFYNFICSISSRLCVVFFLYEYSSFTDGFSSRSCKETKVELTKNKIIVRRFVIRSYQTNNFTLISQIRSQGINRGPQIHSFSTLFLWGGLQNSKTNIHKRGAYEVPYTDCHVIAV